MKAEIVAIGTELLLGDVVNSNAAWLGHQLAEIGIDVERTEAVGDNIGRIAATLAAACERADVVIATGGLGPTQDDLTREALAALTGARLVRDPGLEAALRARYAASGRPDFAPNNLRMADYPDGATVLANPSGTAPALRVAWANSLIYALPGVPSEMRELFSLRLRPELVDRAGQGTVLVSRHLHTVGWWESEIADALAALDSELDAIGNPTLAYLASEGQTRVRITAKAPSLSAAADLISGVEARVRAALGDIVYGADDDTLESVAQRLLLDGGATVATAESLTGGLLGAALTSMPGSSATFRGGVVVYATETKSGLLDVPADLLHERGAVDPDVAIAMARGVRARFGATYGLATTGVAGPTEQDGKPVGTVFVALAGPDDDASGLGTGFGAGFGAGLVRALALRGDRGRIRRSTVVFALDLLRRGLSRLPAAPAVFRPDESAKPGTP